MSSVRIRAVQRCCPQVYLACHGDHVRTKSNRHHLSAHDSALLAHLDESLPPLAGSRARDLRIANASRSAALNRLEPLGHLTRTPARRNMRRTELRLTSLGAEAMTEASVLDARRVVAGLENLSAVDQKRAVAGLAHLAAAAREHQAKTPRRKRW